MKLDTYETYAYSWYKKQKEEKAMLNNFEFPLMKLAVQPRFDLTELLK